MARNTVQFQKGLSEPEFLDLYGTEEKCRKVVFDWRWPEGFICPACGGREFSFVESRNLYQCSACRRQTSLTAGTILQSTKVPLTLWFRAMYHLTQSKQGISSLELGRRLGVTQTTAWKLKHKLMQVMMDYGARRRQAAVRPGRDGRRLSRRRAVGRQARARRTGQGGVHCGRGNYPRGQAGPAETAAGQGFSARKRSGRPPSACWRPRARW
jgi:transposase-like protein